MIPCGRLKIAGLPSVIWGYISKALHILDCKIISITSPYILRPCKIKFGNDMRLLFFFFLVIL
jgi:hypothetical protein